MLGNIALERHNDLYDAECQIATEKRNKAYIIIEQRSYPEPLQSVCIVCLVGMCLRQTLQRQEEINLARGAVKCHKTLIDLIVLTRILVWLLDFQKIITQCSIEL